MQNSKIPSRLSDLLIADPKTPLSTTLTPAKSLHAAPIGLYLGRFGSLPSIPTRSALRLKSLPSVLHRPTHQITAGKAALHSTRILVTQ